MEQEENHSGKGTIPILNGGTPVERRHSFKIAPQALSPVSGTPMIVETTLDTALHFKSGS